MIADDENNNPKNNFYRRVKQISESVFNEQRDAIRKEVESNKKEQEIPKIDKNGNSVKWTDVAMVVISAFLAYYTWRLFNVAIDQSKSAQQSADAAIAAVHQDSTIQAKNDSTSQIKDSIINLKDSVTIALANQSIQIQANSANETAKRFQKENEPFLEITNLNEFSLGDPIQFSYQINNVGKFPAQIIEGMDRIEYVEIEDSAKFMAHPFTKLQKLTKLPFYITTDNPFNTNFIGEREFATANYTRIKRGELLPYYICKIRYKNLVSGKTRIFSTVIKIIYGEGIKSYFKIEKISNVNTN